MLQHKKLVPSLHSNVLNPNIDFEKTPFVVQQVYEDWKKPIINEDGRKVFVNRRGSISAFGAGGTNVHLILEEYDKAYITDYMFDKSRILVLSAKTKKALKDYANKIIEFADENTINMDTKEISKLFANITYTLQVGRETMPYRIAFIAQSIEDITYKLRDFIQGNNENIYTNHVRTDILEEVSYKDSLEDIARKWTEGYIVDWTKLYQDESPIKISLPTYPYQLERCWLSVNSDNQLLEEKVTTSNTICQDNKQNIKDSQEWGDMEKYLRNLLGEEFGISPSRIDLEDTLDIYGIDSVMITNLTKKLEDRFGELSKTLFFEYQTLEELIKFFVNEYSYDEEKEVLSNTQNSQENRQDTSNSKHDISYCDIAIVGIAGTYPEAQNLDELWNNLLEGRDSISEIPIERWDYSKYKDYINKPDIKLSKWGGFIEDIDKFDPLFFNISPAEAELMDPQERVFLQTSWETIEDAGYTRNLLKDYNVGVYVGVTYGHYQMLGVEETLQGNPIALNSAFSAVANRVSYCLNLTGPSLAVDTMCSSSLTALHLACESIYLNECDMAIAGGINLAIHPSKYLLLGQTGFTSSDGRCRSFGAGGDGYVPGEGSGALLIKPLNRAVEDRDHIYGIIKGTVMNHGGKTNGFTVPNPNAQSRLIEEGLSKAGISPKTISYIEAHGTGTALGDPIEITALTKAYDEVKVPNACAIGSIKSNIGHLESASGIAGITKVLLQMKYTTLVPSIHANNLNPNINFTKTPFYVQRQLEQWKPKEVEDKLVRRASVSSFGAGGSNAHVIIEDYNRQEESYTQRENESYVITLSAKNKERLHDYVEKYIEFCNRILGKQKEDLPKLSHILADIIDVDEDNIQYEELLVEYGVDDVTFKVFIERVNTYLAKPITEHISLSQCTLQTIQQYIDNYKQSSLAASNFRVFLRDMAYTLQMCRESYCEKVAFVVSSIEELQNKCVDYIQGNEDIEGIYIGNDKNTQSSNNPLLKGNIYNELIMKAFDNKEFDSLAQLWVSGSIVPWHKLYEIIPGRRVSLPTYPFAKESYWIERVTTYEANDKKKVTKKVIKKGNKKIVKETNKKQIVDNMSPEQFVISNIKKIVSDLIKLQEDKIDLDENFGNYGLDSLKLTALSNEINELLDINIEPTITFSHSNIESLGKYILETYGEKLGQVLNRNTDNVNEIETIEDSEYDEINYIEEDAVTHNSSKIAIIGMDARMPGANNLDEFWKLLEEQRNSITEIPTHRFNWEEYYATTGKGKTNTKWGGFIQDEDKFDAGFFSISPFEAERMDPQQRLLLQTSWNAIEDAGYHIAELAKKPVGVFTTIQRSEYPNMLVDNISDIDGQTVIGSMESMVANRISYIFNFTGPSEAINTACSSSLVALNRGIKSIINKECDVALVGGACLALSPESFITQSSLGVLSSDGQCKTFDAKANGFVKGEGVGSILLKGYEQAVKDGDNIYAVICGSSVNHGGKSNSLTAPNAVAQSKLIVQVLEESGVDPATISYIETHGTGTKLGDPVEINGLTNAFSKFISSHNKKHYCGLGSVKTNIGHLEPMAGLASVFKMVLALQHRKMPGIVNFTQLNPYIHLEETPFYIVEETMPWERIIDDEGVSIPRRTGISSFGIGGTNAHIILEEYTEDEKQSNNEDIIEKEQMLFVLSAKNTQVLKEYAKNMLHFIEDSIKEQNNISLRNLTYTLQIGRMNLDERLAICISSTQELVVELQNYIENNISKNIITNDNNIKQKTTNQQSNKIELLELNELATNWVNGEIVNFKALYDEDKPRRISLPTYPFEKNRYWISNEKNQKISKQIAHPYITYNNSSLLKSCYVTNLEGSEYYLKHSLNKKEKQLPCMVMLEMVREACSLALEKPIKSLYNVTCQQNATIIDTPFELGIDIYPHNQHDVKFEINNHSLNEEAIFAQGYGSIDSKLCEEIDTHILRSIDLNTSYEQRKVDKHVVLNPFIMERVMNILIDSMTSHKLILLSSNIPFYISELHVLDKLSIDGKLIINKEDIKHRSNYIEGHYDITYKNDEGKTQLIIKDIVIKLRHDWLIETNKTHKNQLDILEDLQHGKCNIQEAYSLID
jgi:acyl transferase domain-containing protein